MEKQQRLFITGSLIEMTIKQMSVGKSQILSSRRLLANLKYYQADDMTSHKRIIIIIIIIRRFIKRRSSAEAEGKGAVHVFNVLEAIIRMFKKMYFEPRFKSFQGRRIFHMIWEAVPRSGSCDRERTIVKLRGRPRYLK